MGHTLHLFTVVENVGNVPVEKVEMEGTETGMTPEAMLHYLLRIHGEQQRASLAIMESLERNTAAQEQRAYQEAGAAVCLQRKADTSAPKSPGPQPWMMGRGASCCPLGKPQPDGRECARTTLVLEVRGSWPYGAALPQRG
ncbi:hypothetical protein AAFF_G00436620 [Aldrovandia affinis]|uniref:Uncharacterized protein n=1 Tax=Aldrovandia affinis TaxID=143900 RepID=A0AAD7WI48_9TELE|nr:hypothetical protein AAFF_G00436620 [Aldrovandia affinis]